MTYDGGGKSASIEWPQAGAEMIALAQRLYPICRSITGHGVRRSLEFLFEFVAEHQAGAANELKFQQTEIASGTPVLDWQVPDEWNIEQAVLYDPSGKPVVSLADHNLHLLNYSEPTEITLTRAELEEHLYSLPEQPTLIPYRTSYYQRRFGFCLPHQQRESLPDGLYRVAIDGRLEPGHLTYGEMFLPGKSPTEVLLSAHICHPSLANDNLSGLVVLAALACVLAGQDRQLSYRFLFAPGTIGAITWLAQNRESHRVAHGLVAANLGGEGAFHYKQTRRSLLGQEAAIDRSARVLCSRDPGGFVVEGFEPFGYDERQYNSPGFNLAVGSLTRTPWGRYPEYHTSADNLELLDPPGLAEALSKYLEVLSVLEQEPDAQLAEREPLAGPTCTTAQSPRYRNREPFGEPQLGRRGLYSTLGGGEEGRARQLAILWVLNLSDGFHTQREIETLSQVDPELISEAIDRLTDADLLEALPPTHPEPS